MPVKSTKSPVKVRTSMMKRKWRKYDLLMYYIIISTSDFRSVKKNNHPNRFIFTEDMPNLSIDTTEQTLTSIII